MIVATGKQERGRIQLQPTNQIVETISWYWGGAARAVDTSPGDTQTFADINAASTSSRQFQIAKYSLSSKHFNFCGGNITHKERTAEGGYDLLLSVTPRERYPDGDSEFGPLLLHREYILHTTNALLFWATL